MKLQDAIQFIQHKELSIPRPSVWADLGCGSGTFTAALAHFLMKESIIHAVDRQLPASLHIDAPDGVRINGVQLDFVKEPLPFVQLDGIVMANALHYVKDKSAFIAKIQQALRPEGLLLIVEYNTDKPVPTWVPYPLSFSSLEKLFQQHGYRYIEKMRERTSVYGNANLYTALIKK
jgi:SAM-dependent methyltransferase